MSWHYSQALVAAYSADSSADSEPSAPSKSNHTAGKSSPPGKTMERSNPSRSGTMCEPSTASHGVAWWISSLAASRAKTSASPGEAKGSTVNEADSGWKWLGSFVKWDRASSSWKTRQCSLIADLDEFSETWPKWGMMLNGECLERAPLVERNTESESGFWQTPTTRDAKGQSGKGNRIKRGKNGNLHVANLCDQIVDLGRPDLVRSVTFRLWLMGWPEGWTSLEPLETAKFRQWLRSHGSF